MSSVRQAGRIPSRIVGRTLIWKKIGKNYFKSPLKPFQSFLRSLFMDVEKLILSLFKVSRSVITIQYTLGSKVKLLGSRKMPKKQNKSNQLVCENLND